MANPNKHKQKSLIPQTATHLKLETTYLNRSVALLDGWKEEGNEAKIFVSLRFVNHDYQCFSAWKKQEMKIFWQFQEKISNYTWQQLFAQSGKTDKTGFAYTEIDRQQYPTSEFKDKLSPDITLFEVRANDKIRLHGFRHGAVFYIC
jgi:hypothetical protein